MTNETPDNAQPDAADMNAGQHDFAATLSSEGTEAATAGHPALEGAPVVAAPESAVASEAAVEPEPVVEPTIPPIDEPLSAQPAEIAHPAEPVQPADAPAPAYETLAPPYEAPVAPAPAYGAAPAAYPGATPTYDPAVGVAVPQDGTHAFPAGGQATGGYPNAAYPNAEYQAGGYPAGAYSVAPAAPKKPMSKGLLFGIIGGAALLVLLIAAVIVVPNLLRGPAPTASGVVEEYLTAIADGDSAAALEFVDSYSDDSLLNDEVLAASLDLAPITDIVVEEPEGSSDDYETVVTASFAIGGETIERDFTVWNYGDEWQIGDGLVTTMLSGYEGLGVTVNGVEPGEDYPTLFPGTYQLSLAYDEFELDSDTDTFTLVTDDDAEMLMDVRPVLTDAAGDTFRALVREAIEECVALKTLTTPCGMDITDIDLSGYTPVDGSVTRTLTEDGQQDLDEMQVEPDYSTPTLVTTYDSVDVDMTLQGTKDGVTSEFEVWFGGYTKTPSVDFAAEAPTVTWE